MAHAMEEDFKELREGLKKTESRGRLDKRQQ